MTKIKKERMDSERTLTWLHLSVAFLGAGFMGEEKRTERQPRCGYGCGSQGCASQGWRPWLFYLISIIASTVPNTVD